MLREVIWRSHLSGFLFLNKDGLESHKASTNLKLKKAHFVGWSFFLHSFNNFQKFFDH